MRIRAGQTEEKLYVLRTPASSLQPHSSLPFRLFHSLRLPRIGEDLGRLDGDSDVVRPFVRLAFGRLVAFGFVGRGEGAEAEVKLPLRVSRELWRSRWMETASGGRESRKQRKE